MSDPAINQPAAEPMNRADSSMRPHPTRYVHLDAARARYGDRVDRFGAYLWVGDPLADDCVESLAHLAATERTELVDRTLRHGLSAEKLRHPEVPSSLRALLEPLIEPPVWVDGARMNRGGAAFVSTGLTGGLVLGCYSLVLGYCSPTGNKPIARSGRLQGAARRRLAETAKFVQAVTAPDGMRVGGEGWISAVKVRLMHASVRRLLLASPSWPTGDWGVPINAFDSAGTVLLFSQVMLEGLQKLGVHVSREDREALLHLWRYTGCVMGVPEQLLFANETAAHEFWELASSTQEPPDEDSRMLAHTLLDDAIPPPGASRAAKIHSKNVRRLSYAISRKLLGPTFSEQLGYPAGDHWDRVLDTAVKLRKVLTHAPVPESISYKMGRRYWSQTVTNGLGGTPAEFAMFARLGQLVG